MGDAGFIYLRCIVVGIMPCIFLPIGCSLALQSRDKFSQAVGERNQILSWDFPRFFSIRSIRYRFQFSHRPRLQMNMQQDLRAEIAADRKRYGHFH